MHWGPYGRFMTNKLTRLIMSKPRTITMCQRLWSVLIGWIEHGCKCYWIKMEIDLICIHPSIHYKHFTLLSILSTTFEYQFSACMWFHRLLYSDYTGGLIQLLIHDKNIWKLGNCGFCVIILLKLRVLANNYLIFIAQSL